MAVTRETLIQARNRALKRRGIPLKAVIATKTNTAAGLIAWAARYSVEDQWYRDARDAYYGLSGKAPKYETWVAKYIGGNLGLITSGSHKSIGEAKEYLNRMIRLYAGAGR